MISIFGSEYGFLLPGAFAAAAAIGTVLLIYAYLRRGKTGRIAVASTMFLKLLENVPRARRKFLPPLRFFLELLLLLMLAGAAAGLYIKNSGNKIAVLLDNSAGMQAIADNAGGQSLFSAALDRVKNELAGAGWGSKYNIYLTSPVLTSITGEYVSGAEAMQRLYGVNAGYQRDNLQVALEKLNREGDFNKLLVVSDKLLNKEPGGIDLTWIGLKSAAAKNHYANAGLSNVRMSSAGMSEDGSALEVSAQSYSSEEAAVRIKLSSCPSFEACRKPRFISEQAVSIRPGSSSSAVFNGLSAEDFAYYIELVPDRRGGKSGDALSADNSAWITAKFSRSKILLVSEYSSEKLGLSYIPTLDVTQIAPSEYPAFSKQEKIKEFNTVIFHHFAPNNLPALNIIFVSPPQNPFFDVEPAVSNVQVSRWKTGHPLLSYINLSALKFSALTPFKIPNILEPLIYTPRGIAAFVGELNGKRMAALGFEIFPYEGRHSTLLSVLTLNIFKWISEVSSDSGFQRIDYPLALTPDVESVTALDGKVLYKRGSDENQKQIYPDKPSLLEVKYTNRPPAYQAIRFYNPEESNTIDLQEVRLGDLSSEKAAVKDISETASSSLASLVIILLLLDLSLQLFRLVFKKRAYKAAV